MEQTSNFRNESSFMALSAALNLHYVCGGTNKQGNSCCFFYGNKQEKTEGKKALCACYLSKAAEPLLRAGKIGDLAYYEIKTDAGEWCPTIGVRGDGNVLKNLSNTFDLEF